jgi:hypothetical protein
MFYLLFKTFFNIIRHRPGSVLRDTASTTSRFGILFEGDLWHRHRKNAPGLIFGELSKLTIQAVSFRLFRKTRKRVMRGMSVRPKIIEYGVVRTSEGWACFLPCHLQEKRVLYAGVPVVSFPVIYSPLHRDRHTFM